MENFGMNNPELRKIEDVIKTLSDTELHYINRLIIERVKLISQARSTSAMGQFNIGEEVFFIDHLGREIIGRITRLNKKTISLQTREGENWKVSPGLLKATIKDIR